jgi:hypothetical protein
MYAIHKHRWTVNQRNDTEDVVRLEDLAEVLPDVLRAVIREAFRSLRDASRNDPNEVIELEDIVRVWPNVMPDLRTTIKTVIADEVSAARRRCR